MTTAKCFFVRTGTETQWDERSNLCEDVNDLMEAAKILKIADCDTADTLTSAIPGLTSHEKRAANQERDAAAEITLRDITCASNSTSGKDIFVVQDSSINLLKHVLISCTFSICRE